MTAPAVVELDQSFRHDGHRLVYDSFGEGDQVVIYLHGLLLDSQINRGIARALADRGQRVILLDLLGHGRSDKPTHASHYRIDRYAEQVVGLLDHLGVPTAVLGGISLGANVSLFVAATNPERVRALVLEMPVLEWAVPAAALTFAPLLLFAHYGAPVMRWLGSGLTRLPRGPSDSLNGIVAAASAPPEVVAAVLHGILVGPVAPTVEQRQAIGAPTLVVAHGNDLIHPFDDARNLAEHLGDARLVRSRSALELRLLPGRLMGELGSFVTSLEPALR